MDRASLVAWWEGLAARERTILACGGVIVLLVAVYLLLIEPPVLGIRKLHTDVPELRTQEASMRAMADEAARLRAAGGSTQAIAPAERVAAVRRSLQRSGLWREGDAAAAVKAPDAAATGGTTTTVSTLSVGGTVTTVSSAASSRLAPPEITADTNDRIRVRFDDIDYGVWIAWLAATEGELAARATKVSVVALAPKAPVGHVRAEALLDWTQSSTPASASRS